MKKIAFIGGGNMATSLIGGLVNNGWPAEHITVSDPSVEQLAHLQQTFGVRTSQDNAAAVAEAAVIVLAVKPQVMQSVCLALAAQVQQQLIISIAAGIPCAAISQWLGSQTVIRCMPNTPALIGAGISGLFATAAVSAEQQQLAETILQGAGQVSWLTEEAQIDAVTAVSGSGPAYFFLLVEAMIASGEQLGLSREVATQLAQQTALGAAKMLVQSPHDAATLRQQVTSPQGTTEAAINTFLDGGFMALAEQAITAAATRSQALAQQLSQ
ncbi:pyrroline-5-carboxylate reductase [Thiopseudomonas alkaliphila]|uniref:pyrroline-5-carboxylate reductase n=1 Tax=Thiopseudomonas alkaliphila TaxID=1697053 RepID=UPI002577FECD|nr:pyrroline-5-carboxylate reductase [Thiopseudomonas alkaliphila]MDM1708531.1 pyrroline-5-carboxylate reductase [Thiopseudomonas alkaliphila]